MANQAKQLLKALSVSLLIALIFLTIASTFHYYGPAENIGFFFDKGELSVTPLWRTAFYLHVSTSMLCLVCGPLLVSNLLLKKSKRVHRILGWAYVGTLFCWAAPSGLVLAIYAMGGLAGKLGFLTIWVLWIVTTAKGVQAVRRGQIDKHIVWMIRSYALTLSALSFRVFHLLLPYLEITDEASYIGAVWLSLLTSIIHGELGAPSRLKNIGRPWLQGSNLSIPS
ncbi:MAG: DUF2306 domain-containing protein [Planctomycetota bacterium]|nr:DUF2306 domain-containing protein [Planctomycetota bacterium]